MWKKTHFFFQKKNTGLPALTTLSRLILTFFLWKWNKPLDILHCHNYSIVPYCDLLCVQKKKKKPLDFLHCYHHSIVPFSAWLGFCGWFMPIITGLFFFYSALALRRQSGRGFVCGWPIPIITGPLVVGLFWCFWSLLLSCLLLRGLASVGGSSLVSWMLVSFGVIGLFCCVAGLLREVYAHYHWSFFFLLFCGWFMPIITGLFVVGHFRCYWSLLFSHITWTLVAKPSRRLKDSEET